MMVNQILGHLTSLNDHGPSKQPRHTCTSDEFQTCQPIISRDINIPSARHPGTSKDNLTLQGDLMSDSRSPNSQLNTLSQPRTALDSLPPEDSSLPRMTQTLLVPSASSLKPPSGSMMSSTLSPSTSSSSASSLTH